MSAFVVVGPDENIDSAIRRFKKQLEKEGILKEFRRREYFEKASMTEHTHVREIQHKRKRKLLKARNKRTNYGRNEKEAPREK